MKQTLFSLLALTAMTSALAQPRPFFHIRIQPVCSARCQRHPLGSSGPRPARLQCLCQVRPERRA